MEFLIPSTENDKEKDAHEKKNELLENDLQNQKMTLKQSNGKVVLLQNQLEKMKKISCPTYLESLPVEVWRLIRPFVFWKEWNGFVNLTKVFRSLKFHTLILKLNKVYSMEYYMEETFRKLIQEKIHSTNKQLHLVYEFNPNVYDVTPLKDSYSIKFSYCPNLQNINQLEKVSKLSFCGCQLEEQKPHLNKLKNLLSLEFSYNMTLAAEDIQELGNIPTLKVSSCSLSDISSLGKENQKNLDLSKCLEITNVSNLSNLDRLNLSGCIGIQDISSLAKIHYLDLSYCTQITDVSCLGKVHTLNLTGCANLSQISGLGEGNYSINLSYCRLITNVSNLSTVTKLNLAHCIRITDVSMLGNCFELNLTACEEISDVNNLGNVHTLILTKCHKITDISGLGKKNYYLDLRQCHNVYDVSSLTNVHTLNLSYSTMVETIYGMLTNVKSLNISGNNYINDVSSLENVEVLDISYCKNILYVGMLKKLRLLIMYGCHFIQDLNELPPHVMIKTGSHHRR